MNARNLLAMILIFASNAMAFPFPTNWQPILNCDNGAAVVDVNTYERRMVQLVVRDPAIVDYFWRSSVHRSAMTFLNNQIIVSGEVSQGVFNSDSFQGFEVDQFNGPAVQVYKSQGGLILRVVSLAHEECIDYRENDYYCAASVHVPEAELANWFFRSCH